MPYSDRAKINNTVMWFLKPSENWLQSLPLGNGHIGCMINNDPCCDILCLNDDTLWSGYEHDYCKKDFKVNMSKVKELMAEGEREKAEKIVETSLTNRFTQAYLPFGDILIQTQRGKVEDYKRELDMSEGIVYARYVRNGNSVKTETFVSYPDDVLIHAIECDAPSNCEIFFRSQIRHNASFDSEGFSIIGCAPSDIAIADVGNFFSDKNKVTYDEIEKSVKIAARAQIISDGCIAACSDHLSIRSAKKIVLVYSSTTSFLKQNNYTTDCKITVLNAIKKGVNSIRDAHINDHSSLFDQMYIDLGGDEVSCDDRYTRMRKGQICNSDISLLFHYGRYLLIGSSRNGTQAANLQGIWNKDLIPPWWSAYTLNINLQMNYWLADRTNLSSCYEPLAEFVKRLCEAGKRTARENYGIEGAVAHHQSDIWAHTTPVGHDLCKIPFSARWMMWNMSLPWLCVQLFDHYLYTLEPSFLENVLFPIMKDTAKFIMSNFTEIDGSLHNIPSTSPENMYINESGKEMAICNISAMDIGITREFFDAYVSICKQAGCNAEADGCIEFANRIADYGISKQGELLEWDREYEETESGHRHFSMLFGVYPGSHLLKSQYAGAAKKSLIKRLQSGSGQTGWSAVWAIALLARFGEGDAIYNIINKLMSENIHENMFGAHPPGLFQIDANLGFTAAVCEMILQEYDGVIKLLPALPENLADGSIYGLKIHSGHVISLSWRAFKVINMQICAAEDDEIIVQTDCLICDNAHYQPCLKGMRIFLKKGSEYHFYAD